MLYTTNPVSQFWMIFVRRRKVTNKEFKSYSHVIALSLVNYFDRYYRTQDDPYLETREREEQFVCLIVTAVEKALEQTLPIFFAGCMAGLTQGMPQSRTPKPDLCKISDRVSDRQKSVCETDRKLSP